MQLIFFTMLIKVQFVAHTAEFIFSLHRLLMLKFFDGEEMVKNAFGA